MPAISPLTFHHALVIAQVRTQLSPLFGVLVWIVVALKVVLVLLRLCHDDLGNMDRIFVIFIQDFLLWRVFVDADMT
jgi:hypothetical protein